MSYLIGGAVLMAVFFILTMTAFKAAINTSSIAQDIKEIKIMLMEAQNRSGK